MLYNLNLLLCSYMLTLIHFGLPPKWHQIQSMGLFLVYHIMSLTLTFLRHSATHALSRCPDKIGISDNIITFCVLESYAQDSYAMKGVQIT